VNIVVRHAEPEDYRDLQRIYSGCRAVAGTLQLPLQSEEKLRKRLSKMPEGTHHLVACVDGEVVGELGLGRVYQPAHAAYRQYRDGCTRRLAGQGHRDGADGGGAGPGGQLAQPDA
jgi:hypothetical protein